MSPRQQETIAVIAGAISLGALLVSFHQPDYSPLPIAKAIVIIIAAVVGACLGLVTPTMGRAILSTVLTAILAAIIQVGIQSISILVGVEEQQFDSLVAVYIQQATLGVGILAPVAFIGAFVTSIID